MAPQEHLVAAVTANLPSDGAPARVSWVMTTFSRLTLAGVAALALGGATAMAHHSAAAFDTRKEVTINGTVKSYRFANPHVQLIVTGRKDDGSTVEMDVEAGAASVLNGLGFTSRSLKVGEIVTITGNPARLNPETHMLGKDLYKKADGSYLPLFIGSRSVYDARVNATANSIEGTWFSPMRSFTGVMGAAGRWPLTEQGRVARAAANPNVSSQADCIPIGEPTVMVYPVATSVRVEKDKVTIKTDWMDTVRTVYLDGRRHPAPGQTFLHGHSVGRWDGKVLVVETTNFRAHPSGLGMTLPSSTQKKLVERFALGEDGRTLEYSGTVEDPVYLSAPGAFSATWEYRPTMPFSNQKCDVQIARQFLKDLPK